MSLSNVDIMNILKKSKLNINDIIMRDHDRKLTKGFYIVNLDDSNGGGTHWTALYYDGLINIYMDSFGMRPPKNIESLLSPRFMFNKEHIQNIQSDLCGYYCILFIKMLNSSPNKINRFNEFVNMFYIPARNEEILKKIFKLH